jgi:hypothetical protein
MSHVSPDAGPSTPPHSSTVQTKSSPVKTLDKYYPPDKRKQYQKFGYDSRFYLGAFNEARFLESLDFDVRHLAPEPPDYKVIKEKQDFFMVANAVSKAIAMKHGEHYLFLWLAFLADI